MSRLVAIICLCGLLWRAVSEGQWVDAPAARRSVQRQGHLGDIISRVGRPATYMEADPVTSAHECTHGINSDMRQQMVTKGFNCFYLLEGRAAVVMEPRVTLATIAAKVPPSMRARGYRLYLIDQQRYWNNEPLYILDELSAYLNGATVAAQLGIQDRFCDSFQSTCEFLWYAYVLRDNLPADYDAEPLKSVIKYQTSRYNSLENFGVKREWIKVKTTIRWEKDE